MPPTRRQLESLTGRLSQAAGIRRLAYTEGPEAGVEVIEVRTGAGLRYEVLPQRGLDIHLCEFRGASIAWHSPNGPVHPARYEEPGIGWLRSAAGGLLMTCGLTQVGSSNEDAGESLGIHGRIHHLPAREVLATTQWGHTDETQEMCDLSVCGIVQQTRMFGETLSLHRCMTSATGENKIKILDSIRNDGFEETPFMMLYHFNFGWPLLTPETKITFPSKNVRPREPETPLDGYDKWETPQPGYAERVYYHENLDTSATLGGRPAAQVALRNDAFPGGPVEVQLRWGTDTLPRLVQWKMPGQGMHVLGIEPANCWVGGRVAERAAGTLRTIKPGETIHHSLELEIKG